LQHAVTADSWPPWDTVTPNIPKNRKTSKNRNDVNVRTRHDSHGVGGRRWAGVFGEKGAVHKVGGWPEGLSASPGPLPCPHPLPIAPPPPPAAPPAQRRQQDIRHCGHQQSERRFGLIQSPHTVTATIALNSFFSTSCLASNSKFFNAHHALAEDFPPARHLASTHPPAAAFSLSHACPCSCPSCTPARPHARRSDSFPMRAQCSRAFSLSVLPLVSLPWSPLPARCSRAGL
jgi:hypothetical protein